MRFVSHLCPLQVVRFLGITLYCHSAVILAFMYVTDKGKLSVTYIKCM